jgi:hypothetical protein
VDSYRIESRLNPVPNATLLNEIYVVPVISFAGKDDDIHDEFQSLLQTFVKLEGSLKKEKKTAKDLYKPEVVKALHASKAIGTKITQSPVLKEFDELQAENQSIRSQLEKAQQENNKEAYMVLLEKYLANREKILELFESQEMKLLNKVALFSQELAALLNDGKWKKAHEYVMQSGLVEMLGYQPPEQ